MLQYRHQVDTKLTANKQEIAMNNSAIQAVVSAYTTPEVWCGDDDHDTQVVFGNGVYTVGSNGDVQDYTDSDEATVALSREWDKEDQYRLSEDAV